MTTGNQHTQQMRIQLNLKVISLCIILFGSYSCSKVMYDAFTVSNYVSKVTYVENYPKQGDILIVRNIVKEPVLISMHKALNIDSNLVLQNLYSEVVSKSISKIGSYEKLKIKITINEDLVEYMPYYVVINDSITYLSKDCINNEMNLANLFKQDVSLRLVVPAFNFDSLFSKVPLNSILQIDFQISFKLFNDSYFQYNFENYVIPQTDVLNSYSVNEDNMSKFLNNPKQIKWHTVDRKTLNDWIKR